jgi:hypothetical protein
MTTQTSTWEDNMNARWIALLAIYLSACDAALPEEEVVDSATQEDVILQPLYDFCANAEPDRIAYVGSNDTFRAYPSGNGAYAYGRSCPRWVVDYKLATYSPEWEISGEPWDLPSSAALNGTVPNNAHDCGRYETYLTFYKKKSSEAAFTKLGATKLIGEWKYGECKEKIAWGTLLAVIATPPQAGWDTYRVAVGAKLRSSFQEVRAVGRENIVIY